MDVNKLRNHAIEAHGSGQLDLAEDCYKKLLAIEPSAPIAANYGALLRGQGRLLEAEQFYLKALKSFPSDRNLLSNACNVLRDLSKADQTLPLLQACLDQFPNDPTLRKSLALSLHHCKKPEAALKILPLLAQELPNDSEVLLEYGACLAKTNQSRLAAIQFEHALRLLPSDDRAEANLIIVLVELGELDKAKQRLVATNVDRESPRMLGARAQLLLKSGDISTALKLHERLTHLEPDVPDHWLNAAMCLKDVRYMVLPKEYLTRAFALDSSRSDIQVALGSVLIEHGEHAKGLHLLNQSLQHDVLKDEAFTVFQFAAGCNRLASSRTLKGLVNEWEVRRALPLSNIWRDRLHDPDLNRRLRVGYLSPDFSNHPVGRIMAPLLESHDSSQVDLVALSCSRRDDRITQRLRASFDSWHDLHSGRDEDVARYLAELNLDIIVDLGGYTADQRLRPLLAKPAPIQLSYLGYPSSTFLNCIDGWIGDAACFGSQQHQECGNHEKLLKLPRAYLAFLQPEECVEPVRLSEDRRFRFGSFNHSRKLSEQCLDRFSRVIRSIQGSVLVLKSTTFVEEAERDRIQSRLEQRGLSSDQFELLPRTPGGSPHLSAYGHMDVALDTCPYSGTTTSCEALWMGVPVLTVLGASMVERQTASVLMAADLGSAICTSEDELIQKAQRMAARGPRDRTERLMLREHVSRSDLADPVSLARSLESLYRTLWQGRSYTDRL